MVGKWNELDEDQHDQISIDCGRLRDKWEEVEVECGLGRDFFRVDREEWERSRKVK